MSDQLTSACPECGAPTQPAGEWADRSPRIRYVPPAQDSGSSLNTLAAEIREINCANGWNICTYDKSWPGYDEQDPLRRYHLPAVIALIHSELSEALEAFRKADYQGFTEELADVLIRVLDCAHGLGTDIDAAVRAKVEKNRNRGYRHGGKTI